MTEFTLEIDDEIEDDEDDYIFDDDDWDDADFPQRYLDKYPGYHMLKIQNFNRGKLADIDRWCQLHLINGHYERVGWTSGCSTSVGIVIEDATDAMMFKLAWS